jgi:MFS superfamily sulfate permease-like transporter
MFRGVLRQGREQFMPFIVTIIAVLLTDLLIGVFLGFIYAVYFLIKHTYRAGYVVKKTKEGHTEVYHIDLALNVSFLNKKRLMEFLDQIPPYSEVHIHAERTIYIDHDVLEIFHDFRTKAHNKHIELVLVNIPDVETIELH